MSFKKNISTTQDCPFKDKKEACDLLCSTQDWKKQLLLDSLTISGFSPGIVEEDDCPVPEGQKEDCPLLQVLK